MGKKINISCNVFPPLSPEFPALHFNFQFLTECRLSTVILLLQPTTNKRQTPVNYQVLYKPSLPVSVHVLVTNIGLYTLNLSNMNTLSTRILILGLTLSVFCGVARAQFGTGVLNPSDPVITYNPQSPPANPPYGNVAKWVRTKRVSYNTDDFKCYIYNGLQFRLKWPTTWTSTDDGKQWPV
jgi:hypothetical protein